MDFAGLAKIGADDAKNAANGIAQNTIRDEEIWGKSVNFMRGAWALLTITASQPAMFHVLAAFLSEV